MTDDREFPLTSASPWNHVAKFRDGRKKTSLRTVKRKNLFAVGETYPAKGEDDLGVEIRRRDIIRFGPDTLEPFDDGSWQIPLFCNTREPRELLVDQEGFDSFDDLLSWFQGGNPWGAEYDLPQPFFLYRIKPVQNIGEGGSQ